MVSLVSKLLNCTGGKSHGQVTTGKHRLESFESEFQYSLVVANVLIEKGFYVFASEASYEVFKRNKMVEFSRLDLGMKGIPILFIIKNESSKSVSGDSPLFLIYKFKVRNSKESKLRGEWEFLVERNGVCLDRLLVCKIYQQKEGAGVDYKFFFDDGELAPQTYTMSRSGRSKDMYTNIQEVALAWNYCDSIYNEHDDYKLQVLGAGRSGNRKVKRQVTSSTDIVAYYSRALNDFTNRRSFKQANIFVGGKVKNPFPIDLHTVELIACEALLLHYLEYQIRAKKAKRRYRHVALAISMVRPQGYH